MNRMGKEERGVLEQKVAKGAKKREEGCLQNLSLQICSASVVPEEKKAEDGSSELSSGLSYLNFASFAFFCSNSSPCLRG